MMTRTVLEHRYIYSDTDTWMTGHRCTRRRDALHRRERMRFLAGLCIGAACVLLFFCLITGPASDAASASHKVVSSVYIEPEDTLWSIAQEYYTKECGSMQEYVQEIKDTNGLSGDGIHAGGYLIIPYYVME